MKKQTLIEQSLETLKNNGFKYTKKREALLTYLVKRNRYVSAKEVFDYMNQEFKGVSYDTIYRNLHDFAEIDLLEETDLNGEMKFRFHCCQGDIGHLYGVRNNERNPYVSNELFRRTARWMYDRRA